MNWTVVLQDLLERWRAVPDPDLAGLIEDVGPLADDDVHRLLDTLDDLSKTDLMATLAAQTNPPRDPRWSAKLVGWFDAPPYVGPHALWRDVMRLVTHHRDPRAVPRLSGLDQFYAEIRYEVNTALAAARTTLPWPEGTVDPASYASIRQQVDEELAAAEERLRLQEELYERIVADPDDIEARLVYADLIGGERGEFVVLQCQDRLDRAARKRMNALAKSNGNAWLGDLAKVVVKKGRRFERGFLVAGDAVFKNPGQLELVLDDPRWGTVQDLEIRTTTTWRRPDLPWRDLLPRLPSLRRIRGTPQSVDRLYDLLFSDGPWPVRHIRARSLRPIWTWAWEDVRVPSASGLGAFAFPDLEELHLPMGAARVMKQLVERGARIPRLRLSVDPSNELKGWETRDYDTRPRASQTMKQLANVDIPDIIVEAGGVELRRQNGVVKARKL